ncbi:MAG: hypothetical protein HY242_06615 [Afipia sp.]|nr:hypothetical protein [Afipia sp.]
MMQRRRQSRSTATRIVNGAVLCAIASALCGCATGGVTSNMFVDPSRYDLYDCKQLATAREAADKRAKDLEALITKAETGAAGALVSGLAYQADYSQATAQRDLIDQKMAANNCAAEPPPVIAAPKPVKKKRTKQ